MEKFSQDYKPLVSIIIPTYNRFELLTETLESVLQQTFQNWECLVIDDGSSENNIKNLSVYLKKDRRFSFYQRKDYHKPKGANACRNIGIQESKGKYILFLDSDDILKPFCLSSRIDCIEKNPEYDFVVFQMNLLHDNQEVKSRKLTIEKTNYLYAFLSYEIPWQTTAPFFKSTFIKKLEGFDEKFPRLQDPEFYTRALLQEDVKFEVLVNYDADALYRSSSTPQNHYENYFYSLSLYFEKFARLIKNRKDEAICLQHLKSNYNTALQRFEKRKKNATKKETALFLKLTYKAKSKKIISIKECLKRTTKILVHNTFRNNQNVLKAVYYKIRYPEKK